MLLLCACSVAAAVGAAPAGASQTATVADTQPAWANPANLTQPAAANDRMVFSVWLGWHNTADLDGMLQSPVRPHVAVVPPLALARRVPCPLLALAGPGRRGALVADRRRLRHRRRPRQPPVRDRVGHGRRRRAHVRRVREHVPDRRDDRPGAGRRPGRARGHRPRRARDHRARRLPRARHPRAQLARPAAAGRDVGRPVLALLGRAHLDPVHQPVRTGDAAAVADLRVHAGPDRLRLRHQPAAPLRARRPRPDDRDHRRVLLPHHPPGRRELLPPVRPAAAAGVGLPRAGRARHAAVPAGPGRDAELVHRAGARRRVGPRGRARAHGSSTSAPPTMPAGSTRRSTRSSTITWRTSSRTAGACRSRSRRAARSWR